MDDSHRYGRGCTPAFEPQKDHVILYSLVADDGKRKWGIFMFDEQEPFVYPNYTSALEALPDIASAMKGFGIQTELRIMCRADDIHQF